MKRTKFKSNKEALKHLKENGKYNANHELVVKEGVTLLNYTRTTEDKESNFIQLPHAIQ